MKIEEMEINELISFRENVSMSLLENKDKFPIYDRIEKRAEQIKNRNILAAECEYKLDEVMGN
ncbi:hypothetical protein KKC13_08755 [bacterium]|nr:hypothetical protein [bacterium]MBU1958623.1 hypothetical protein [bacterium]